jgi:hypothetical protein
MLNPHVGTTLRQGEGDLSDRLLRRICVQPPYFAFEHLSVTGETLIARAKPHPVRSERELGPMSAAELSRHGAIAGLCAAALTQSDDERRYYLASEAWYQGFANPSPPGTPVTFMAQLNSLERRRARATITATANLEPVMRLEVDYTILAAAAFARLFANRRSQNASPQAEALPPGRIFDEGQTLVREIEAIPAGACAGHFDGYPALPVAVLMGQLANLAGQKLTPHGRYRVASGHVFANDFCWAGEAVRFAVRALSPVSRQTSFECEARVGPRASAGMRLVLEMNENHPSAA